MIFQFSSKLLIIATTLAVLWGQNKVDTSCEAGLVPNIDITTASYALKVATLSLVDQSNYEVA